MRMGPQGSGETRLEEMMMRATMEAYRGPKKTTIEWETGGAQNCCNDGVVDLWGLKRAAIGKSRLWGPKESHNDWMGD